MRLKKFKNNNQNEACKACKFWKSYSCVISDVTMATGCEAKNGQYYPKEEFKHGELLYCKAKDEYLFIYNLYGNYIDSKTQSVNLTINSLSLNDNSIYSGHSYNIRKANKEDIQRLNDLGYTVKDNKFVKNDSKQMKEEDKYNKWYYNPYSKWMTYITSENTGFGFDEYGNWITYDDKKRWGDDVFDDLAPDSLVKEKLLEYAKKKYPVGTTFLPSHVVSDDDRCIVTNDNFSGYVDIMYSLTDDERTWDDSENPKYGNTSYNRVVYCKGKWAKIIESEEFVLPEKWYINPKDQDQYNILIKWKKGDEVKNYTNYAISYAKIWITYPVISNFSHYKEITFEQFKKYVLKEDSIDNSCTSKSEKWSKGTCEDIFTIERPKKKKKVKRTITFEDFKTDF